MVAVRRRLSPDRPADTGLWGEEWGGCCCCCRTKKNIKLECKTKENLIHLHCNLSLESLRPEDGVKGGGDGVDTTGQADLDLRLARGGDGEVRGEVYGALSRDLHLYDMLAEIR